MQVTSSILGVPATGSYHDLWVLDLNRGEHTIHELNLGEQSLSLMLEPGFYEVGISVDMMGEPTDGVTIAAYSAEIVVALEESDPVSVATQSWGHIKALYRQ